MRVCERIATVIFVLAVAGHSSASAQRWIEPISPIPDRDTKIDFAPASAALTDEARTILDRQAKILISHPQETAIVYGHADPYEAGSRQGAWDLGLARAVAARAYLVSKGVASKSAAPGQPRLRIRRDHQRPDRSEPCADALRLDRGRPTAWSLVEPRILTDTPGMPGARRPRL